MTDQQAKQLGLDLEAAAAKLAERGPLHIHQICAIAPRRICSQAEAPRSPRARRLYLAMLDSAADGGRFERAPKQPKSIWQLRED